MKHYIHEFDKNGYKSQVHQLVLHAEKMYYFYISSFALNSLRHCLCLSPCLRKCCILSSSPPSQLFLNSKN
ncbi:hypothetical protein P8452_23903 [Trifolium repens]|nr:hypothetical protein P8452_23903 [Trifolium repens]